MRILAWEINGSGNDNFEVGCDVLEITRIVGDNAADGMTTRKSSVQRIVNAATHDASLL